MLCAASLVAREELNEGCLEFWVWLQLVVLAQWMAAVGTVVHTSFE